MSRFAAVYCSSPFLFCGRKPHRQRGGRWRAWACCTFCWRTPPLSLPLGRRQHTVSGSQQLCTRPAWAVHPLHRLHCSHSTLPGHYPYTSLSLKFTGFFALRIEFCVRILPSLQYEAHNIYLYACVFVYTHEHNARVPCCLSHYSSPKASMLLYCYGNKDSLGHVQLLSSSR